MSAALLAGVRAAGAAGIQEIELDRGPEGIDVSLSIEGALPEEIASRIDSGLEVSFEYTIQLKRQRGLLDRVVSERYVQVSVKYSNLTKVYKLRRQIDGAETDNESSDRAEVMRSWLTEFDKIHLFDPGDLVEPGIYYVRAKVKLLTRFRMLLIPWDLETSWAKSESFTVEER